MRKKLAWANVRSLLHDGRIAEAAFKSLGALDGGV